MTVHLIDAAFTSPPHRAPASAFARRRCTDAPNPIASRYLNYGITVTSPQTPKLGLQVLVGRTYRRNFAQYIEYSSIQLQPDLPSHRQCRAG